MKLEKFEPTIVTEIVITAAVVVMIVLAKI